MSTTKLPTSAELAKKRSKFKRKMLLVGVNEYSDPRNNLAGCVNDVLDVQNTMRVLGIPRTQIRILTDFRATKANVMKQLDWLVKDAKEGDVLGFYFSGHGSYVTDVDGDEHSDGVDEVILPTDFSFRDKTYITDDELHAKFTGATPPGVRCEIILDSCHSGTGSRSLTTSQLPTGDIATARFLPPPMEYQVAFNDIIPSQTKFNYIGGKAVEKGQHNVAWYACQDYQVAWEMYINGQVRGCFTQSLMEILRRSNGNKPRGDVYNLLRNHFLKQRYQQTPGLDLATPEQINLYAFRRNFEDDPSEVAA